MVKAAGVAWGFEVPAAGDDALAAVAVYQAIRDSDRRDNGAESV